MAYAMLVAAVVTAVVVTGLCLSAGWRKVYVVAPLQFLGSLAVTSLVGPLSVSDIYADDAFWMALVISTAIPALFVVLRVIVGLLDKPDAGGLTQHAREPASHRGMYR